MAGYKPKEDFDKAIGIQEQYILLLKNYHAELMMKTQKSKGFQQSKYRVDLHELSTKLDCQIKLYESKKFNYETYFLPDYDKQLKDCEENYDSVWFEACKYIKLNKNEVSKKMKNGMDAIMELDEDDRKNIEVKNVVYQDLKTLLSLNMQ